MWSEQSLKKPVSLCILGFLLGVAFMFTYTGREIDRLYLRVSVLQENVSELSRENADLQLSLVTEKNNSRIRQAVKSILVEATAPDALTEIETIRIVKMRLSSQMDKEVSDVSPNEVIDLVNGWTFDFHRQQYRIRVISVIISTTIAIRVQTTHST